MALDKVVFNLTKKFGSEFYIYSKTGDFLGAERASVTALKRSADEDLASFMRVGTFHSGSKLEEGCIILNVGTKERFVVSTKNPLQFSNRKTHYAVYLLKINCTATIQRKTMNLVSETTAEITYTLDNLYENVYAYMRKKDWTMEQITMIGREQRGYETFVFQDVFEIEENDRIIADENFYIVQYISRYKKEGYLVIQAGIEVKQ